MKTDLADVKIKQRSARRRHDRDFRIALSAIIAVALGLAMMLARSFHSL